MTLKERIINELKNTGAPNIDRMLQFMEKYGYFDCHSHSHNNWKGGAAQHMWAVYLIAKALRDERLDEPNIAKYATDKKLAIVCLLHDLCDMDVPRYGHDHGTKSYNIIRDLHVGTKAEQFAVKNHMDSRKEHPLTSQSDIDEYNALHSLVHDADHKASGTAWNSTRFKANKTQHHGVVTDDMSYLRAVAMDRSVQSGKYHMYVDEKYDLQQFRNYNRDLIRWNSCEEEVNKLKELSSEVCLDGGKDTISAAHEYTIRTGERLCLVVSIDSSIPNDKETRLRRRRFDEQDILICSNLLNSFYSYGECKQKGKNRHRYEFTMKDEIKKHYRDIPSYNGGIYLPCVKMIRDGAGRGFPFVEPWDVDLLLVPGKEFATFAIKTIQKP